MNEKTFTLREAEQLIPVLENHLKEIRIQRTFIANISGEIQKAAARSELGGGTPFGPSYILALDVLNRKIEEIQSRGILIKDLDKGLCDFPHLSNGRTVYLCWRSGEPSLKWWHETEEGFAGRKKLEEL